MADKEHWTVALHEYERRRRTSDGRLRSPNPLAVRLVHSARERARGKGLPFDITSADVVIPDYCPALDIRLFTYAGGPGAHSPSLDRIQPHLGYVRGNVAVISMRANAIKGQHSLEELCVMTRHGRPCDLLAVTDWLRRVHPDGWMYGPR